MNALDVSVIVPTYREAESLPVLVPRIHEAFAGAGIREEIIVVDDDSPDQTRGICADLSSRFPLILETRIGQRGLSSAVIRGLELSRGERLLVMDADLSHPPESAPNLIRALDDPGVDFVIGSRYVPGGSTEDGWGLFRWLNSRIATLLARPFTSVTDPMAGFFALRRSTFTRADQLNPIGYKIGLELLVKCRCRKVVEVPIHFQNRLHGATKLTAKEQLNYLRHLCRLFRYKRAGAGHIARLRPADAP